MIQMQVAGLTLDETTKAPILLLKQMDGDDVLPIWIGAMEAMAISIVINEVTVPRPLTHDLMLSTLTDLGASLSRIEIIDLKEGTFYAELELAIAGSHKRVDCRPSDAIALALRADAPIMVSETVLKEASKDRPRIIIQEEGEEAEVLERQSAEPVQQHTAQGGDMSSEDDDKLKDLLQNLEPDSKYKM